jgi:hypothetical protein
LLADTSPPFWWIGLFASPGGLLIVGTGVAVILIAWVLVRESRRR